MRLKFTTPLTDQTVKEGNAARFELELSHENVPITWYKNETKLHPSRVVLIHVDGKKHILELKDVTLDDTCQIKAEANGVSTTANLMVLGNPIFLSVFYPLSLSLAVHMSKSQAHINVCDNPSY